MQLTELSLEEQIPLKLISLYECYGYKKYKMSKFEPYDLYRENKSFINSENIITFTNSDGTLMAMKPDVTMSIIKNIKKDTHLRKYYYSESVFRNSYDSKELREIKQMGLEYIGSDAGYSETEVLSLAVQTMQAIDEDFIINISHTAFISSLLAKINADEYITKRIYKAFKLKSVAELSSIEKDIKIEKKYLDLLYSMVNYSDSLQTASDFLDNFAVDERALTAVEEIKVLAGSLKAGNSINNIRFDFSVIEDTNYYNGLIFNGYLSYLPNVILRGGRYDNLMKRLNKTQGAIGFALYIGELDRALRKNEKYYAEAKLVYDNAAPDKIIMAVKKLNQIHKSVIALDKDDEEILTRITYKLDKYGNWEQVQ